MNNKTLIQFFQWYYPAEGNLWQHVREQAPRLSRLGINMIWLPPANKSAKGIKEPGYAVYDLYDLGEFYQKRTIRTRFGTKEEYLQAIKVLHQHHINVLADVVLNHMAGADGREAVTVQQVKEKSRNEFVGHPFVYKAPVRFSFPERKGKYSDFIWTGECFKAVCKSSRIHLIHHQYSQGRWDDVPEKMHGNFDYLLGSDIEFRNPEVRSELKKWGTWFVETTGVDGFRLDALKHVPADFLPDFAKHIEVSLNKKLICIGEFWKDNKFMLLDYMKSIKDKISLFDVPLHYSFHRASLAGKLFDLRTIFDASLVKEKPDHTVTFVDNHDTQPLQALESPVEAWFAPLAYAFILLRKEGLPCIFYPSIYGAEYGDEKEGEHKSVQLKPVDEMESLLLARKEYAYGEQTDYFDDPNLVGWVRHGEKNNSISGCAVLVSNGDAGTKCMSLGAHFANRKFRDLLDNSRPTVTLDQNGMGAFSVKERSAAVWVPFSE